MSFVGDGLTVTYGRCKFEVNSPDKTASQGQYKRADTIFNVPRGAAIATLGANRLKQGDTDSYWTLVPNYVRIGLY